MSSLDEIVEEGKSAEETYRNTRAWTAAEIGAADACHRFYLAHGPLLLAVAEAAVEMRKAQGAYFGRHSIESDADHCSTRLADATAAFDAAAGGQP